VAGDQAVNLRLTAENGQLLTTLKSSKDALSGLGPAAEQAGDRTERGMSRGTAAARQYGAAVSSATGMLKQLALGAVAAVGVGGLAATMSASVGAARDFGAAMAEVSTLMSDTSGLTAQSAAVRQLAKEYGQAPTEQAKALYQIISAGATSAAAATETLEAANRLAIGGITDVKTAADGLTTAMNAYGPAVGSATDVSDRMFVAMRAGKTTIGELSASIGAVAPIAAQTGVSLDEVLAATAALTLGGVSTATAMNGIRAAIAAIIKPSSEATELAESLGIQFDAAALKSQGLAQFLDNVKTATGGSAEQMAVLFGGVEALSPVMSLTGNQAAAFAGTLDQMGTAAGSTAVAYEKMTDTAEFQFNRLKAEVGDSLLSIGESMLTVLVPAAKSLADNWDTLANSAVALAQALAVLAGATAIGAVITSLKSLYAVAAAGAAWQALGVGATGATSALKNVGLAGDALGSRLIGFAGKSGGVAIAATALAWLAIEVKKNWDAIIAAERRGQTSIAMAQGSVSSAFSSSRRPLESIETDVERLADLMQRDRGREQVLERHRASLERLELQYRNSGGTVKEWTALLDKSTTEAISAREASTQQGAALKALDKIAADAGLTSAKLAEANEAHAAALRALAVEEAKGGEAAQRAVAIRAELNEQHAKTIASLSGATEATKVNEKATRDAAKADDDRAEALRRMSEAASAAEGDLDGMLDDLNAQLGGPSVDAALRYRDALVLIAEAEAVLMNLGRLTPEIQAKIDESRRLSAQVYADTQGKIREELTETEREAQRVSEAWENYWEGANDAVLDSFAQLFSGGIESMEDFGDQMLQISQRIVGDIIKEFARTGQIKLPQGSDGTTQGNIAAGVRGLGYAYGGYQNAQAGGNPLSTVGSFALAGAEIGSIIPGVGTVIGAAVGAIVGAITAAFASQNETILRVRSTQFNGDRQARGVASSDLGEIFVRGETLGQGAAAQIAAGIADFDDAIAGLLDDDQLAAVRERLTAVNDTFRDGSATIGEALDARFGAILGELSTDVQAFVGTAGDLEDRVKRLAEALAIERIVDLDTIGGTFAEVAGILEQYRVGTEDIGATYSRLMVGAQLFEAALDMAGIAFDGTRQELIRFAADITEAAGGLERAQSLWAAYFETFYTADERAAYALQQARSSASTELGDIGLNLDQFSGDGAAQAFREMFEAVLPTLSAEAIVEWLEAADALGIVINLSGQAGEAIEGFGESLSDLMSGVDEQLAGFAGPQSFADRMAGIVSETDALIERATALGATEQQLASIRELGTLRLTEVLNEQAAAMADYQSLVQGVRDELADAQGLSEFGREMREINRWLAETVTAMNEAARAAGMQGAAESDLAAAHELASIRAAEAIARLQERGRSIVEQLYGTELEQLDEQIRQIEAASGGFASGIVGGMNEVTQATDSAVQAQIGAQQRIRDWLDNLMIGDLGGLRPRDALVEAQALFDRTLASALGGDAEAMAALPGLADQLLRLGQRVYASGDPYFDLRDTIRDALTQVAGLAVAEPVGSGSGGGAGGFGGDTGGGFGGVNPDLAALIAERDAIAAEQATAERRALATELAGVIRELIVATGRPLDDIAATLGVQMSDLVADLGVNLDTLTVATASQLADIAQATGTELTALAASVGVDLGSLADRQSLLNDALEAEIAALPQGQRDLLEPLLRDVEEAAALGDTAGVEAGIGAMEDAIADLSPDLRDMLAPYFLAITPADPATQLAVLTSVESTLGTSLTELQTQTTILGDILAGIGALSGLQPGPGLGGGGIGPTPPGYAVGTPFVPADGLAYLHRGEAVIPARVNAALRSAGVSGGTSDNLLVSELRELRRERREADEYTRRLEQRLAQLETTTRTAADAQTRAVERQTDAIKAGRR
jgi:TP901 family phage tail tape measure protein